MMQDIHEALRPISWLGGRWSTKEGKGIYPNIPDFYYHDEMEFVCIETLKPMHQERGFLRIKPGTDNLAFAVSHNFGVSSIEEGTFNKEKKEITLESNHLLRAQSKPPKVLRIRRVLTLLAPDRLEVTLEMETEETPLTEHLRAIYTKIAEN
ncbi:Uncharacterized protein OBRU01_25201 [Operophtera brumata]|uniref:THAP4-like heme-binding domain-containing protein n=1 Tax=Operophtera brumata TaxID=104452 RepID=A0A0L7KFK4_OPEBR|nr:Uncharacterized protein OBRU01_25201 [Operophtera brumata]